MSDEDEDNLPITEVLRLRTLAQKKRSRKDDDVKSPKKEKKGKVKLVLPIPLSLANYAPSDALLTDITLVRARLERFGVAIVPGVLTGPECDAMVSGVWSFLEHISSAWQNMSVPITRDNPLSWRGLSNLYPMHSMLLQHWGIGHSEFMWAIRQNPAVLNIFSTIWNTPPDQLLVSFDGASVHLPHESTGRGAYKSNTW